MDENFNSEQNEQQTELPASEQPAAEQNLNTQQNNEENAFAPYTSTASYIPSEPVKKSGNGLKIAIIALLAVIIVAAAGVGCAFAFAKDYTTNLVKQMTMKPTDYYHWLKTKQVEESIDGFSDEYDKYAANYGKLPDKFAGNATISIEVADELLAMIPDSPIKSVGKIGLNVDLAYLDRSFAYGMGVLYKDKSLLNAEVMVDLAQKKLFAAIPDFDSRALDLSSLAEEALEELDLEELESSFKEMETELNKLYIPSSDEVKDMIRNYSGISIDAIADVELEKGQEITVNGETVKCTAASFDLTEAQLKDLVKELILAMKQDDVLVKSLEAAKLSKADFEKAIDELAAEIDKSTETIGISAKVTDYIGSKAESFGSDIKLNVASTKIGLKLRESKEEDGTDAYEIKVSVNSLEAAEIRLTAKRDGDNSKVSCVIKPDSGIASLAELTEFGQFLKYSLVIDSEYSADGRQSTSFAVTDGAKNLVKFSVDSTYTTNDVKLPIDRQNAVDITSAEDIDSYADVNKLVGFVFDIYDRFDEPALKNALNDEMGSELGMSVEDLRNLYQSGILDGYKLSDLIDLGGIGGDDFGDYDYEDDDFDFESNENWFGVDIGRDYYYSSMDLSEYCDLGQYLGLDFDAGLSAANLEPEEAIANFLAPYGDMYLAYDEDGAVQMGGSCYVDIALQLAGMTVPEYSYEYEWIEVGEYFYGPGLDDQIVGMKAGDSKVINVTLDDDMFGDFKGINADFLVTIRDVYNPVKPEWSEEFIVKALGFNSLDEALESITSGGLAVDEYEIIRGLINMAKENATYYEVPANVRARYEEKLLAELNEQYLSAYDMTMEDYFLKEFGYTEEDYRMLIDLYIDEQLTDRSFYAAVADAWMLFIDGYTYAEYINENYAPWYVCYEDILEDISEEDLVDNCIIDEIGSILYDNANIY